MEDSSSMKQSDSDLNTKRDSVSPANSSWNQRYSSSSRYQQYEDQQHYEQQQRKYNGDEQNYDRKSYGNGNEDYDRVQYNNAGSAEEYGDGRRQYNGYRSGRQPNRIRREDEDYDGYGGKDRDYDDRRG